MANRWSGQSFTQRHITLASALADYAAIAIENARLFTDAEIERSKLEAILREAEEAILVVNEENRILLCNGAASDIWDRAQVGLSQRQTGWLVEEVIPDSTIRDLLAKRPKQGETIHREVMLANERTYNVHLTPVDDVGRVLMLQDMTHLKELDRLKSEFVATVSHDLWTPLTSIQGYVELLPQVGPLNERQEQFLARVDASLKSITDLISDLLDIRRIEAELDLEMEPCDLREVIDEVVARLDHQARARGQELRWERPGTLPLVRCNPQRLSQAVDNLVNNAIKYTPQGGWIAVTANVDDGHVVVNVSDNGIGIPPEDQSRIFEKFYRGASNVVTEVGGTGLVHDKAR